MSFPLEAEFQIVGAEELKASLSEIWQSYKEGGMSVQELSRALKDQGQEMRAMQQTYRMVKTQQDLSWHSVKEFSASLKQLGYIGRDVLDIYKTYTLQQIRLQDANRDLTWAQEEYNNAVRKSGANSEDAQKALKKLENAQRDYQKAQSETVYGMVGMGLEIVGIIGRIPDLIKSFQNLKGLLDSINWAGIAVSLKEVGGYAAIAGKLGAAGVLGVAHMEAVSGKYGFWPWGMAGAGIYGRPTDIGLLLANLFKQWLESMRAGGGNQYDIDINVNGGHSPGQTAEEIVDALRRRGVL